MNDQPEPFMKPTSLILLISIVALAVSLVAIYDVSQASQTGDSDKLLKLEKQANNTDQILSIILNNPNARTAFDQDVVKWANQTDTRLAQLEQGKK